MTIWPYNTPPARLIARFGVSELPAALAVALLALLQYMFLVQLWQGFPLKAVGDVIHMNVVIAGFVLSLIGGVVIIAGSIARWRCVVKATRQLEAIASNLSFDALRELTTTLARRSTLSVTPQLRYTPKNAAALEVREGNAVVPSAVVVGLNQRKRQCDDPQAFAAQLGHEISHLELAATRVEIGARRLVILHFRVLGWLVTVFLVMLAFIDRRGIDRAPRFWGFKPVWDFNLYMSMSYHMVLLVLSSIVIFIYSYFFAVRREHIHDFRGSQLAGNGALAERVFPVNSSLRGYWHALIDFVQLHPSSSARRRVVRNRDFILLSAVIYPLVVAGAQPLALLLMTGWDRTFALERHWWNLFTTVATGLILYLVLCSDIVRLGLGSLIRQRFWLFVPVYAAVAGIATQIPRIVMEIVFGLRKDFSIDAVVERIWMGVLSGGGRIAVMTALILLTLAYLAAVRTAASGEANPGKHTILFHVVSSVVTIGAFSIASLTSLDFMRDVLFGVSVVVVLSIVYIVIRNRCGVCGRYRLSATILITKCRCGSEHLPLLRRWLETDYAKHIPPSNEAQHAS